MTYSSFNHRSLFRHTLIFCLKGLVLPVALWSCTEQERMAADTRAPEQILQEIFEDYHQFCMRNYPMWATYEGDHRYNERLTDMRPEAFQARSDSARAFMERAQAIDSTVLTAADRLSRTLFIREMKLGLEADAFHSEYQPFSQQGGPHIDFPQVVEVQPLESDSDRRVYLQRLGAFPELLDQCMELARLGIASGQTPPRFVMEQVAQQCRTMIGYTPEESPFAKGFARLDSAGAQQGPEADPLLNNLYELLSTKIKPAYERLLAFIETDYLPACREEPGLVALPDGAARYAFAVRYHTTTSLTPDEVFGIGEEEVADIREQMEALVRDVGFKGDLNAFVQYLRTTPEFYYSEKEPMMEEYRNILDQVDRKLPELFGRLPKAPYDLKEIEEYRAANAPQAYYYSAPEDGSRPGYFYVNTTNLPARPRYTMTALALHEAVPGHHLQIAIAQELEDLPWFRRNISSTAFVEGWGLYAESLGYEMGLYNDPYQRFGALTFAMWRACRLVVDVGLHHKGWSREKAVQFMMANTPNSEADIRSEVDRYIAWPGQALAYKIGERKISSLRAQAEAAMGPAFRLSAFHDRVLEQGPVPLPLLEQYISAWSQSASLEGN